MFSKLEGDGAVIRQGGVYRSCELYTWQGHLFVKATGGYIRLRRDGTTTKDGVFLEHLEYDGPLFADKFGRLCVVGGEGRLSLIVNVGETLQITESHDVE